MLDVMQVVGQFLHRLRLVIGISIVDLSPTGDPRSHHVTMVVKRNLPPEFLDERNLLGPRAHEAHVARQDVPELWNLVES